MIGSLLVSKDWEYVTSRLGVICLPTVERTSTGPLEEKTGSISNRSSLKSRCVGLVTRLVAAEPAMLPAVVARFWLPAAVEAPGDAPVKSRLTIASSGWGGSEEKLVWIRGQVPTSPTPTS